MIKSMTGFGKCTKEFPNQNVTVEIRSLNSKNADISLKLPSAYRANEIDLRNEITKQLERGKIDVNIYTEKKTEESPVEINIDLAKSYYAKLKDLREALDEPNAELFREVIKMGDVMRTERKEPDEESIKEIHACLMESIAQLQNFRIKEGESLERDFQIRLTAIGNALMEVEKLDTTRTERIKNRIKGNLKEVVSEEKIDANRFEQELIYYIEKLDLNEEKVRLKQHLDYFTKTMKEPSTGRKLNFIAQEIGREINTIGSKANDAGIQKLVVLMKDELEKIKEQTNNVL